MDAYWHEWLNLLLRWIHLITGIAWIGASFYFNWLEGNLDRKGTKPERIAGDLWSVHGGGFYHSQKYEVAPAELPGTLHWFEWEAYATWLSGFALLILVYYLNPSLQMLGENPLGLAPTTAVIISLATLAGGWIIYDLLCRTPLVERALLFALTGWALLTGVAFALSQVFDGRAAYIQVGAMIGTVMVANVFFVIIPAQRRMVAAMSRGELPDPGPGKSALRRSLHNNYLTLPVLFIMISAHFPGTFGHSYNWAILAALGLISAWVRHYFNLKNQGRRPLWLLPAAFAALALVAWLSTPRTPQVLLENPGTVAFAEVRQIIDTRCMNCHSDKPTHPAFPVAPLGYVLDTNEQIRQSADKIFARTVATHTMPLANLTGMTDEERARLGAWIAQGSSLD